MNKSNLIIACLLLFNVISAQKNSFMIPDSLKKKSYEYLDNKFYTLKKDSAHAAIYAYSFLKKARLEKNSKEIMNGYQNLMLISPNKIKLIYVDSILYTAKKSNDYALIGAAYLTKGTYYYGLKHQKLAMDYYLTANSYVSKTNDQYQIHKVKYCIALTKFYVGFYDEAVSLLRECVDYYKNVETRPYLNSIHMLGLCYNKLGNYGLCTQMNALGISESKRLKSTVMIPYYEHSEGINDYFKGNYAESIKKIDSSLEPIIENEDFANVAIGNFYVGKSYWSLNKKEKASKHFQIVDSIFKEKKYLRPDLRQAFELLINYNKTKKDLNNQLYYINELLKADTLLVENNTYIVSKIHKQYDTKELIQEKEKILVEKNEIAEDLKMEQYYDIIFACVIFLLFIFIIWQTRRYYKRRKIYEKNFELRMQELNAVKNKPKIKIEKEPIKDINIETVSSILKQLENFEIEKKFLGKDWNLVTLAAAFNSNTKYLAAILSYYRDMGMSEYINGLRIEYIINLLQTEPIYRKYTYEALAQEAGFSSTQRFANAFLAKAGMPVSFFIQRINKSQP
ncbi:AraC family transcriptional regulator [Flavobacterium plurextorum]|uniref:helix-turn-helix domain-containing protein n=1 Tax=Flavobacterium plurextorum TaxID=1114867 RepID=UPI00214DBD79|nr:helix-turn-helix domain-containing protein [Flavobacterium plurextorum]UUW11254.1 AraC family transcriptional regulator [Flavobacterium plurextorum]